TILPTEIEDLHNHGITRIYSPDDGRKMGLQGMIDDLLSKANCRTKSEEWNRNGQTVWDDKTIGQAMTAIEEGHSIVNSQQASFASPVLGITGTGGAGKSSLTDELVRRFLRDFADKQIAILSVDPSRRRSGGALLGDRIRMNTIYDERVYMRSMATRQSNRALSQHVPEALALLRETGRFDLIILESAGVGQSDTEIVDWSDVSVYVMTPEFGAASQLEKIDMLDFADVVAINKSDKRGSADALRDVKKQVRRNHNLWTANDNDIPVYGTVASQFNDIGTTALYCALINTLCAKTGVALQTSFDSGTGATKQDIIPPRRVRYLAEIAETIRNYDAWADKQAEIANQLYALKKASQLVSGSVGRNLEEVAETIGDGLDRPNKKILDAWPEKVARYGADEYVYQVRGRDIKVPTFTTTMSHNRVARVSLPKYSAWGDILKWSLQENVPGEFPFTAGVFPFKRQGEDPTRMFAGEGGPERTNKRFHYVSHGIPAKRLSTAFDSVTLYGNDPAHRPDIYGKVGNSGVSVPTLDDAKRLYSGFDLINKATSVSMTINGPAATILAFYMNAAIDQQCERYIREHGLEQVVADKLAEKYGDNPPTYHGELPDGNDGLGLMLLGLTGDEVLSADVYAQIKTNTLRQVRGTVQADILKEDQAQNTCIYSTEFSLRLMGDIQQYFIDNGVRNFYSVSISGYHMAEAGANPISQLAFTLANGFTFLEYYMARGMSADEVAPNFSFFLSNGIDAEYAVLGRVARRIWSKALKLKYGAGERAQKLKYHIQTSGRSLHAQEIGFNDIRTTLQALSAIYDNCNSLHTNAYDEAITTPTEESVRRAMAIQLIINRELGLTKNENPLQGSFIIEELTDLVEEAVLLEFERLTERGGVLGAMERMYQRSKIQEESMYYEHLKHSGELPIIGVNTFLSDEGSPTSVPQEVIRSTTAEKERQIANKEALWARNSDKTAFALEALQQTALQNENTFDALMEAVKHCSLGQITNALFEVGGQYRRSM
ncbi:MAG: methylmalonyl-CoA mutase family protein, partial [Candidatus Promineifilaceae bacterium]